LVIMYKKTTVIIAVLAFFMESIHSVPLNPPIHFALRPVATTNLIGQDSGKVSPEEEKSTFTESLLGIEVKTDIDEVTKRWPHALDKAHTNPHIMVSRERTGLFIQKACDFTADIAKLLSVAPEDRGPLMEDCRVAQKIDPLVLHRMLQYLESVYRTPEFFEEGKFGFLAIHFICNILGENNIVCPDISFGNTVELEIIDRLRDRGLIAGSLCEQLQRTRAIVNPYLEGMSKLRECCASLGRLEEQATSDPMIARKQDLVEAFVLLVLGKEVENSTRQRKKRAKALLAMYIKNKLQLCRYDLVHFVDYVLETTAEFRNSAAFCMMTGAEYLKQIACVIAESNESYDASSIKEAYCTVKMIKRYSAEDIVLYLARLGLFELDHIILVDTGFQGTVTRYIADLISDGELLKSVNRKYGLGIPVKKRQVKIMLLYYHGPYTPQRSKKSRYVDYKGRLTDYDIFGWNILSMGLPLAALMDKPNGEQFMARLDRQAKDIVYFLDDYMEAPVRSPIAMVKAPSGRTSVILEESIMPGMVQITKEAVSELITEVLAEQAAQPALTDVEVEEFKASIKRLTEDFDRKLSTDVSIFQSA